MRAMDAARAPFIDGVKLTQTRPHLGGQLFAPARHDIGFWKGREEEEEEELS